MVAHGATTAIMASGRGMSHLLATIGFDQFLSKKENMEPNKELVKTGAGVSSNRSESAVHSARW
ncbi:hypothetical protein KSD_73720 [Ktedonobacter sp. SOSP1-85]|nr:hypothetical protein KSD_73720 [Ktedonobacter sp. SOSP1-85]